MQLRLRGGGTCLNAPISHFGLKHYLKWASLAAYAAAVLRHPEGFNPYPQGILSRTTRSLVYDTSKKSSLFVKLNAGLLRLKHLTRSRLTALHSLAAQQACSSLSSLAPRNDAFGFTLAEVLVTLGIIGVISAMTVPSLIQNYQRQSYVVQLHKFYNELSQALMQYQTQRNALSLQEAGLTSLTALDEFFKNHFKIVNDCNGNVTPCFADEYKNMLGKTFRVGLERKITLASGTSVSYGAISQTQNIRFVVYVDTNGSKGPNIAGRDVFAIYIYNNGVIDDWVNGMAPMTTEQREAAFNAKCADPTMANWYGCFGKILNDNWQMTY